MFGKTLWILTVVLSGSLLGVEPGSSRSAEPRVNISTYDFAKIGAKTLMRAEQLATAIFASAGIGAQWTSAALSEARQLGSDASAFTPKQCDAPLRSAIVRVQLLAEAPRGFAPQGLGYALPCAQRGVQVTIYADRVEAAGNGGRAAFYRVLGHAIAHEIGHVLLRSNRHQDSGVMKGLWTKLDWQLAAVSLLPFTAGEAMQMKANSAATVKGPDLWTASLASSQTGHQQ